MRGSYSAKKDRPDGCASISFDLSPSLLCVLDALTG